MRRWEDGREGRPDPAAAPARPGAVLAGLAVVPLSGEFPALVGSLAVVFALVALSFVILTGWTGYVSLGQVVPYGLGAYGTFVLSDRLGLPVLAAVDLRVRHVRAPQTFSREPASEAGSRADVFGEALDAPFGGDGEGSGLQTRRRPAGFRR